MLKELNSQNFKSEISSSKKVILVDFFATWCNPCKMMSTILEGLSGDSELSEKISMFKIDIDTSNDIAESYSVMSVPTLVFFKGGNEIQRLTGFINKEQLKENIIKLINQ